MDSRRILLLERDPIEAGAATSIIVQAGHLVIGPVHDLESALKRLEKGGVDIAFIERDLGEGSDSIPVAEALSAAGIPYAFIEAPGEAIEADVFPGALHIKKPLHPAVIATAVERLVRPPIVETDKEVATIRRELQEAAMKAGPPDGG
jgi:two-component SAPR family response regulator